MPATMVTLGTLAPGGAAHYADYAAGVLPLLRQAGATIRERLQGRAALVGATFPELVAVIEFPDDAAMHAFLASAAYRALIPHREKAFTSLSTFACEAL